MTASLHKSLELFSVFKPISVMLYRLYSSFYFQVLQSLYQSFGDCTECTNYDWYHRQFHIPQFFSIPKQGPNIYLSFRFFFFNFTKWSARTANSTIKWVLISCRLSQSLVVWPRLGYICHCLPPDRTWRKVNDTGSAQQRGRSNIHTAAMWGYGM